MAHRISKLDDKKYEKAIESVLPSPKPIGKHEENMKRFGKK